MNQNNYSTNPFSDFQPLPWPQSELSFPDNPVYTLKRNHGIKTHFRLHNPNDEINDNKIPLDKVLIEYRINHVSYNLFTLGDLFTVDYPIDVRSEGNILGDIAERIARRVTKYFLKHFSSQGKTGGIFDKRFNPEHRNNFIVTHTDTYVLKIQKYPNLIILKKTGQGKFGYENIKELDGLFDYRINDQRHLLVLESKLDRINVQSDELFHNLFEPLKQLIPHAYLWYILFSDRHALFRKKDSLRLKQLRFVPLRIFEKLKEKGIGVLFFSFNETRDDFERMKNHLITQYRSAQKMDVQFYGKMVMSDKKIVLFDDGETPKIKLIKDVRSGMWKEVKLFHKRKK